MSVTVIGLSKHKFKIHIYISVLINLKNILIRFDMALYFKSAITIYVCNLLILN